MIIFPSKARRALAADELVGLIDEAIVVVDRTHRIVRFNRAAETVFGWRAAEVLGQPLDMLLPERFHMQHGVQVEEFAAGPLPSRAMALRSRQIVGLRRDGSEFPASVQIARLGRGRAMQLAAIVRDAGQSLRQQDEALRLAAVDPLTGAYNRREMNAMAEREALRARRYHHPLSLLLLDLDNFRALNDAHGVALCDSVVQGFADMCAHTLRSVDLLGRWSSKEFIILLPETPIAGAEVIAERLRRQMENMAFGGGVRTTVSIGVTQYRDSETEVDSPLARADLALADAKRDGRNRIAVCRP